MNPLIIATFVMYVQGQATIPESSLRNCKCTPQHRAISCAIGNLLDNDRITQIVSATNSEGEQVNEYITVECRQ